jgi:Fic family protein
MKPYEPGVLPIDSLNWGSYVRLIGQANAALARFDGVLQGIINPGVLLSPMTTQEAVLSSRIEGTRATLEEVLAFEAAPSEKTAKYEDIQEIINYRRAMNAAVSALDERPISLNLIRDVHSTLLDGVRGQNKARGDFRRLQNWIGTPGSTIDTATYVPPAPQYLMDYLSNWEKYVHYDEEDKLVQLAIIHAQFELIHPFLDGNGRVGRILIPLFLFEKEMLSSPMFYLSEYLESHRSEYYEHLRGISEEGDWDSWIKFFLDAVTKQAKVNCNKAISILNLYNKMKKDVPAITHSRYSIPAIDALFTKPVFTVSEFTRLSKIPVRSALRLLSALQDNGILTTVNAGGGNRPAVFTFSHLLEIVG